MCSSRGQTARLSTCPTPIRPFQGKLRTTQWHDLSARQTRIAGRPRTAACQLACERALVDEPPVAPRVRQRQASFLDLTYTLVVSPMSGGHGPPSLVSYLDLPYSMRHRIRTASNWFARDAMPVWACATPPSPEGPKDSAILPEQATRTQRVKKLEFGIDPKP